MNSRINLLKSQLGDHRVKEDIDISDYLESKRGGKVQAFYLATSVKELTEAIDLCDELKLDYMVIGAGTKVDLNRGFEGLVIKNRCDNIKIAGIKGSVSRTGLGVSEALIEAESGVSLDRLAKYSAENKFTGLESLLGVPGTIGGSMMINPNLRERVTQVKVLSSLSEIKSKTLNLLAHEDIILTAVFELKAIQ